MDCESKLACSPVRGASGRGVKGDGDELQRSLQLNIAECGHHGDDGYHGAFDACQPASPEDSSRADLPTEQETQVVFEFPDGSVAENIFKMGQTVEVLKAHLSAEFDFEMQNIVRRVMLDPLSLSDFEDRSSAGLYVQVDLGDDETWLAESKTSKK
ncbi:Hypothetical Protein FCC1311_078242 [Hondaea fermentalgiana]|uniref:Uncharacterized protein n=1 Tax=Hondaea fermentalgiana TaxID=2315210 RepID=A0A2R5GMS3_9STRA|nr:Hypothetical Protein FCC1311_078242 [Hondaea fermentalgiana]|eukprot:GBG31599.1 Hypothetical Protein FCC1311_078242 [Hondaea fermentalgiana]